MAAESRFETMRTSYGRAVEVGRLCFHAPGTRNERVILDVPRQNPEYDTLWLALSPDEARDLAGLLMRHAAAAESWASAVGNGNAASGNGDVAAGNGDRASGHGDVPSETGGTRSDDRLSTAS